MAKRMDPRFFNNLIDANVLDVNDDNPAEVVDEVLQLAFDGKVILMIPHSVKAEIEHPRTPTEVKSRALGLIYTDPVQLTANEIALHERVREIVQGDAKPGQHDRDAFHMVESAKYGGNFITNDRRLLARKAVLDQLLGIAILRPSEFLKIYHEHEAEYPGPRQ